MPEPSQRRNSEFSSSLDLIMEVILAIGAVECFGKSAHFGWSGMSGGIAWIYDPTKTFEKRVLPQESFARVDCAFCASGHGSSGWVACGLESVEATNTFSYLHCFCIFRKG